MPLITFTTKNYPDIMMFGDIGQRLLKMMGHSTTVPGTILASDVPEALERIKTAIDAENALPPDAETDEEEPPGEYCTPGFSTNRITGRRAEGKCKRDVEVICQTSP